MALYMNTIQYIDCLDENEGLYSLPDKSFDLGYTDPPWGVGMGEIKERKFHGRTLKWDKKKSYFKDKFDADWNLEWFTELERVCNAIIFVTSAKHKFWWIRNTDPIGEIIIHWKNGFSASKIAFHSNYSSYLVYGKLQNRMISDILGPTVLKWGFIPHEKWVHPSPKGVDIALKILRQVRPLSLLDPFAGSGSYLKAAEVLEIPWLGYEINRTYKRDIDKRFSKISIKNWL